MARFNLPTEDMLIAIEAFTTAGADLPDFDAEDGTFWDGKDHIIGTDETAADWITARGEPTRRIGDVMIWDETSLIAHPSKPKRNIRVGRYVYVLPCSDGTSACVVETL